MYASRVEGLGRCMYSKEDLAPIPHSEYNLKLLLKTFTVSVEGKSSLREMVWLSKSRTINFSNTLNSSLFLTGINKQQYCKDRTVVSLHLEIKSVKSSRGQ